MNDTGKGSFKAFGLHDGKGSPGHRPQSEKMESSSSASCSRIFSAGPWIFSLPCFRTRIRLQGRQGIRRLVRRGLRPHRGKRPRHQARSRLLQGPALGVQGFRRKCPLERSPSFRRHPDSGRQDLRGRFTRYPEKNSQEGQGRVRFRRVSCAAPNSSSSSSPATGILP